MELFTMKYEHQKHRMALEMLGAERGSAEVRLGCLAHRKDDATGEAKPEGLLLAGAIPVKELTRWATRKGYLNWQRKDLAPTPGKTDTKATETKAEKPKDAKKSAPTEKKTPAKPTVKKPAKKPTKEKKNARHAHRRNAKSIPAASRRR